MMTNLRKKGEPMFTFHWDTDNNKKKQIKLLKTAKINQANVLKKKKTILKRTNKNSKRRTTRTFYQ